MSAFLCGDCHLTALAAYAVRPGFLGRSLFAGTMQECLEVLYRENVASFSHLYNGRHDGDIQGVHVCRHAERATFSAVQIIKAAHCYSYQACEHDEWPASKAKALIDSIVDRAVQELPGYEDAAWGIDCEHPKATAPKPATALKVKPSGRARF